MPLFVNGRRVITKAPGAIVKSISYNFTGPDKKIVAYENICRSEDLENCCETVMVDGYPVACLDSYFPRSYGDEAGNGGGIKSGTINGKGIFITGSPDVLVSTEDGRINNVPIIREGDLVIANNGNCEPAPILLEGNVTFEDHNQLPEMTFQTSPSPYVQTHVIHGVGPIKMNSYLVNFDEGHGHYYQGVKISTGLDNRSSALAEDVCPTGRREFFKDLPQRELSFGIINYSSEGELMALPLVGSRHAPRLAEDEQTAVTDEAYQSVMVKLSADVGNDDSVLDSLAADDYRDLVRLPEPLREKIHDYLMHYQLRKAGGLLKDENVALERNYIEWSRYKNTAVKRLADYNTSWFALLPPSMQQNVRDALRPDTPSPLPAGFIYVYVNGHLWREWAIRDALLHEVDLKKHVNQDERPAHGIEEEGLLLPYKLNGELAVVEIAYSEHQWSWARLNYFGGLHPDDFRYQAEPQRPVASETEASTHRSRRFQRIQLTALIDEGKDRVKDENGLLQAFLHTNTIHVRVSAPLVPIKHAASDIQYLKTELMNVVEALKNPLHCEHFHTASMLYHYLFHPSKGEFAKANSNEDILRRTHQRNRQRTEHLLVHRVGQAAKLSDTDNDNAIKATDLNKLKDTLKVDKRQRIRDVIRYLQQALVMLLEVSALPPLVKAAKQAPRAPQWQDVLADNFAQSEARYTLGFMEVAGLVTTLTLEPASIDGVYDLEQDVNFQHATLGERYVATLLDDKHPLYAMLWPKQADAKRGAELETFVPTPDFHLLYPDFVDEGDSTFSFEKFQYVMAADSANLLAIKSSSVLSAISAALSAMITSLTKSMLKEDVYQQELNEHGIKLIKRWFDASGHPILRHLEISQVVSKEHVELGMAHPEEVAASATAATTVRLTRETYHQRIYVEQAQAFHAKGERNQGEPALTVHAQQAANERVHVTTLESAVPHNDSYAFHAQAEAARGHYRQQQQWHHHHSEQYQRFVVKSEHYHNLPYFGGNTSRWLKTDRLVASFLSAACFYNLWGSLREFYEEAKKADAKLFEQGANLGSEFFTLLYSFENINRAINGIEHVINPLSYKSTASREIINISQSTGFLFTSLSAIGMLGGSIDLALSMRQWYQSLGQQNSTHLAAASLKLTNSAAVLVSFFGDAANKALSKKIEEELALLTAKHAGQAISETALKQLAFDSVIDRLGYGLLRRNFIRFAMPFAETGVGIFLIVSGLILDNLLTLTQDSPLVSFVKKSPFALNGSSENSPSDHALVTEFLAMLIQPQAKLIQLPNHASSPIHIRLTLQLPLFDIDHHRLHVVTSASTYQLPLAAMKAGILAPPQAWRAEHGAEIKLQPVSQQTVFNQTLGLSEVSFDYRLDATEMNMREGRMLEINACFQLLLDDHTTLPLIKNKGDSAYFKVVPLPVTVPKKEPSYV